MSSSRFLGHLVSFTVPREPFSFGGLYSTQSKYGDMDITGDAGVEFFSNRIKVTSKWPITTSSTVSRKRKQSNGETNASGNDGASTYRANFAGNM